MGVSLGYRLKRGLLSNLPVLKEAELAYTTDTKEIYIGTKDGTNKKIGTLERQEQYESDLNSKWDSFKTLFQGNYNTFTTDINSQWSAFQTLLQGNYTTFTDNTNSTINGIQTSLTSHTNRVDNPHLVSAHQVNAYSQTETDTNITKAKSEANSYTDGAISIMLGGSPTMLDTLYELANALGNDPNFSTTVLNNISSVNTDLQEHKQHMNPIVASIIFGG